MGGKSLKKVVLEFGSPVREGGRCKITKARKQD